MESIFKSIEEREEAIKWWNTLDKPTQIKLASGCFHYRNESNIHSMTGREIQKVYHTFQTTVN